MSGKPVDIIKIGNSHGIRIPKALLEHVDLPRKLELEVVDNQLVLRPEGVKTTRLGASVNGVKAVVIGGGTGSFMVLSHLRHYVSSISAVVNMSDDGGSTGLLRDELGVLPPGDVRQCLVALSNTPEYMRELLNYRFDTGTLKGHTFGNIFLTALEKISGDFGDAVKLAERLLNVGGSVIPVTTQNVSLKAEFADGRTILGEHTLHKCGFGRDDTPTLSLDPAPTLNAEAADAIAEADLIVIGPGDLYLSIIPALLPAGMPEALRQTKAKKIFVCNLVNKPQTTSRMMVHDYVRVMEQYLGRGILDYVIYNTGEPSSEIKDFYFNEGEEIVECDLEKLEPDVKLIGRNLIGGGAKKQKGDAHSFRSLIRHDGDSLARLLMQIYFS